MYFKNCTFLHSCTNLCIVLFLSYHNCKWSFNFLMENNKPTNQITWFRVNIVGRVHGGKRFFVLSGFFMKWRGKQRLQLVVRSFKNGRRSENRLLDIEIHRQWSYTLIMINLFFRISSQQEPDNFLRFSFRYLTKISLKQQYLL